MSYKQLHDASMTVGYMGGMCLEYVQNAFGTDHPYPTAMAAWNANYGNGNHADQPPAGITVPVYFSLGTVPAGHVAIHLDDGWVASSSLPGNHPTPYYYKSIDDLIADYGKYNGGCSYLGWSEYVGTVRVVQDIVLATTDQIQQAYQDLLGRAADPDGISHYEQFTIDFVRQDLANSPEHRTYIEAKQAAANPVIAPIQNAQPAVEIAATVPAEVTPPMTIPTHPNPLPDPTEVATKPADPVTPKPPILVRLILFIAELFTKKK